MQIQLAQALLAIGGWGQRADVPMALGAIVFSAATALGVAALSALAGRHSSEAGRRTAKS